MTNKTIIASAAAFVIIGAISYASLSSSNVQTAFHSMSQKVGMCSSENGAQCAFGSVNCAPAPSASVDGSLCDLLMGGETTTGYTDAEQKVISYISVQLEAGAAPRFEDKDIENATGVSVEGMDEMRLRQGVLAELNRRRFDFAALMAGSNCTKFSACSINHDLSNATGEELERYTHEKSQDGQTYTDWQAPDFTLPTTAGDQVTLSDYRGKPVAMVFLSGHCSHSFDTLPILTDLKQKYAAEGLVVLPVYVNSGSVEDVQGWSTEMNLSYPLVVSKGKELSKEYDSQMIPSTFLINRDGAITKKFVGFKDKAALDAAFEELVRS